MGLENKANSYSESIESKKLSFDEFIETVFFQASSDYLLREIAGESVLIPIGENLENSNCMFSMNETSAFLWKTFQKPATIQMVLKKTMEEYDESEEVLTRDIFSFVREFALIGLLKEQERG